MLAPLNPSKSRKKLQRHIILRIQLKKKEFNFDFSYPLLPQIWELESIVFK